MVWYSHLFQNVPQFIVIHTVKGFGKVNKAEIDVFLEPSCFFHDPVDVGNLISGSSAFSKLRQVHQSTGGCEGRTKHSREEPPLARGRGGSLEEQPYIQGATAARAQEGQEELLHFQGQEGQP